MTESGSLKRNLNRTVFWTSRLTGAVSFGVLALFVVSHVAVGEMNPDSAEIVGLLFFPVGVMLGLALAFRFDLTGGIISVRSCGAFYLWHWNRSGAFPGGIYFALFTSPAIPYLICGILRQVMMAVNSSMSCRQNS